MSFFEGGKHRVDGKWTEMENSGGGIKKTENAWTSFVQAPLVKIALWLNDCIIHNAAFGCIRKPRYA